MRNTPKMKVLVRQSSARLALAKNVMPPIPEYTVKPVPSYYSDTGSEDEGCEDMNEQQKFSARMELEHFSYDGLVEKAFNEMARVLLGLTGGDLNECLGVIEAVFGVDNPMSWLPCMTQPALQECTTPEESVLGVIKNFARLRHILLSRNNTAQDQRQVFGPEDLEIAQQSLESLGEIAPCQVFKYVFRFNRYAVAEGTVCSRILDLESELRLFCNDTEVKDNTILSLPAFQL